MSIPTLALYQPVRDSADFVLGVGSDTGVLWGAFSEVVVALAGIGTAVVLFPVVKRQSETAALGFVATRVLEAASSSSASSACSRWSPCGTTSPAPPARTRPRWSRPATALAATYDWAFLLSQSLMPVFNALCLGYVLYRSGLVPRILPIIGLVGAPLLLASDIAIFFGVYRPGVPVRRCSPRSRSPCGSSRSAST